MLSISDDAHTTAEHCTKPTMKHGQREIDPSPFFMQTIIRELFLWHDKYDPYNSPLKTADFDSLCSITIRLYFHLSEKKGNDLGTPVQLNQTQSFLLEVTIYNNC